MNSVNHLTLADFDTKVAASQVPVVLDFWAPWCQPCKMLAPVLDALAEDYGNAIQIFKVNVDDEKDARERFSVGGIPTLLIMRDGQEIARHIGVLSKLRLRALIDANSLPQKVDAP